MECRVKECVNAFPRLLGTRVKPFMHTPEWKSGVQVLVALLAAFLVRVLHSSAATRGRANESIRWLVPLALLHTWDMCCLRSVPRLVAEVPGCGGYRNWLPGLSNARRLKQIAASDADHRADYVVSRHESLTSPTWPERRFLHTAATLPVRQPSRAPVRHASFARWCQLFGHRFCVCIFRYRCYVCFYQVPAYTRNDFSGARLNSIRILMSWES